MAADSNQAQAAGTMSKPAGLVANSTFMLLAQAVGNVATGGISIYAIRAVSKASWGQYSTALAVVTIFTVISGLGVGQLALRELSGVGTPRQLVLARAWGTMSMTTAFAAALLFPTALVLGYHGRVLVLIGIISPLLVLEPGLTLVESAFTAERVLMYAAGFRVVRAVVYAATAVGSLAAGAGVVGLAWSSTVAALAAVTVALMLLRSKLGLRPAASIRGSSPFLRAAIPIAGISIVGIVFDRLDVLMLSKLADLRAVATYSVPYNLVTLAWIIPSIVGSAFFPILNGALAVDKEEAERLFSLIARIFLLISLPLALLLAVGSPTLLDFLFGARYASSTGVLHIMSWTLVLSFENYVLWYSILAARRERLVFGLQCGGLAVNAALNAILIPRYGSSGAAGAFVGSELVVVGGEAIIVHLYVFRLRLRRLLVKPAVAAALIVPLSVFAGRYSPLGAAFGGAAACMLALLAASYVGREEWQPLASAASPVTSWLRLRLDGRA